MKFSTKAEYGLKAMANLAFCFPEIRSIGDISREENISFKYLERLAGELRKKKIVKSRKGKNGGYILARSPDKIKVGEIIEILEGSFNPMGCESKECFSRQCRQRKVWMELEKQIRKTLYGIKLSDLVK